MLREGTLGEVIAGDAAGKGGVELIIYSLQGTTVCNLFYLRKKLRFKVYLFFYSNGGYYLLDKICLQKL